MNKEWRTLWLFEVNTTSEFVSFVWDEKQPRRRRVSHKLDWHICRKIGKVYFRNHIPFFKVQSLQRLSLCIPRDGKTLHLLARIASLYLSCETRRATKSEAAIHRDRFSGTRRCTVQYFPSIYYRVGLRGKREPT